MAEQSARSLVAFSATNITAGHLPSGFVPGGRQVPGLIARLLLSCRPSTIARLIVALVVDAVEGMFGRRARAQIGVEIRKRFAPASAYVDAASAVSVPPIQERVAASASHLLPRFVLGRGAHAMSLRRFRGPFSLKTAATAVSVRSEVSQLSLTEIAAGAPTEPVALLAGRRHEMENRQPSKALSGQIKSFHGNMIAPDSMADKECFLE